MTRPVRRVVSLVPSLTESIAISAPGLLVGATNWCTHPRDLAVRRVGGTKSPDRATILDCSPDLVVANEEENRADDISALRAAGLAVWVTNPRTLEQALGSLRRMLAACGIAPPAWLHAARDAWADTDRAAPRSTAVVPIWRRPWMVLGRDTFAGDVLRRLSVGNRYGGADERYPRVPLAELRSVDPDLVVLPDEPYPFNAGDGPECFPGVPVALVSGRHLTWYGPSLVEARRVLEEQIGGAHPYC